MPHKTFLERIVECPSCHSIENMKNKQTRLANDVYQYEVYCEKCHTLHVVGVGPTKDRALTIAIKDWNSKASPAEVEITIKQSPKPKKETVQNKQQSQSLTKPKISFDISLLENLNKDEIVSLSKYLIRKFNIQNPKEDCPAMLGDLLKLFNFKDEEILSICGMKAYSKKFLRSWEDILEYLRNGSSIYYTDECNRVYKYTPVRSCDPDYMKNILEAAGLTLKNTFVIKK